jgi:hypothetical protein
MGDADDSRIASRVFDRHGRAQRRECVHTRLRPFDEHERVVEVRLQVAPLRRRQPAEAVEVEVRDREAVAVVAVADRERRAGDGNVDADGAAGAADERRLSGSQLAGDGDDVAGCELARELRGDGLGLRRTLRATLGRSV